MIRLRRQTIPIALKKRAAAETKKLWRDWRRKKEVSVEESVYREGGVKEALKDGQGNKCAYCETDCRRSHGVVEHFRPKKGWRQNRGDTLAEPGYFWLAYDWENLLFACDMCNDAGHKQNLFPLKNPTKRATPKKCKIQREEPLLINPYDIDPGKHIEWNHDVPRARNNSSKGSVTIDVFRLDRDQGLLDKRRDYFEWVGKLLKLFKSVPTRNPQYAIGRDMLLDTLKSKSQYAAMIRANFGHDIRNL